MQAMQQRPAMSALTLAALGIVFGDIGTSPLYALKECFHVSHGIALNHANVLGVLSLIFWSLMIVVSIKYVMVIMHADNNGEGGIMALLALSLRSKRIGAKTRSGLIAIGLFGAALFFGDGIITPAVSVLSAVEGLSIMTPVFTPFVIPITIAVLIGLFMIQRKGTGSVGRFFGPITLLWFVSLGVLGIMSIIQNPSILQMASPHWAVIFVVNHPVASFITMSAVVLTITGGEALYADMGHFGRKPIQMAWFAVVLPCLLLNYAGQGALLLRDPAAIANPFYKLIPEMALLPMIILATIATVIASQAVISGVFSIARQAMQLGYLPRFTVMHTSESEIGQIYIPFLNWLLLGAILVLVVMFKSSSNLASAYGLAVTMTMLCDTLLVGFVMYNLWRWKAPKVLLIVLPFLTLDLVFFGATSMKIIAGGWFPLLIGSIAFTIMMTWKRGRQLLFAKLQKDTLPLDLFINSVSTTAHTVTGTAVFMTASQAIVPHALLHNLKHNKILHETNILMTVQTEDVPYIDEATRVTVERINERFSRIIARYGFKEQPNVPDAVELGLKELGLPFDMMMISFFVSRERILHTVGDGMAPWREKLFISMSRNTSAVSDFFQIPTNRVVEMGSQIEI
ncbi:potassium transporter Kup [Aquirhabdus parva]|uniref:Probable potassium transport system protein Kup n=1 Tax=Aquirhabdus parva TaxID=2283318 RepID=A0A345P2Z0_9GAMM|nr:potassium transporter Kup [Aquirhabdus parva]AXI01649.1 potassium transporter Kup [Aquirhabdus parva]